MGDIKKITLLVVDDDPDMRTLLGMDFKRQGYQVLEATGGAEAYKIIENSKVNVVVTDILMPEGDGFELIDRVKLLCPACPSIVVVTGCSDLSIVELDNRGVDATFFKPFDRKDLNSTVRRLAAAAS
jgi:two-component system, OmpR family, response regulator